MFILVFSLYYNFVVFRSKNHKKAKMYKFIVITGNFVRLDIYRPFNNSALVSMKHFNTLALLSRNKHTL